MTGEPGVAYYCFSTQLKEGFGIFSIKACTNRLLPVKSKMLTISDHSFLYSILNIIL